MGQQTLLTPLRLGQLVRPLPHERDLAGSADPLAAAHSRQGNTGVFENRDQRATNGRLQDLLAAIVPKNDRDV